MKSFYLLLGDDPRFRIKIGDRFGDLLLVEPLLFCSLSGEGDEPPPLPELRLEADRRTFVSKCRNLIEFQSIKSYPISPLTSPLLPQRNIAFRPIIITIK